MFGTREPAEVFRRLRADPALRYADEAEILSSAEAAIRRAEGVAPSWFGVLPVQRRNPQFVEFNIPLAVKRKQRTRCEPTLI